MVSYIRHQELVTLLPLTCKRGFKDVAAENTHTLASGDKKKVNYTPEKLEFIKNQPIQTKKKTGFFMKHFKIVNI